ncbi:MAG: T9SS type A sorting domain-containing protein [Bacteroides sp.]|nr:T9SS type A sorting domain-containing protein [Roseburia sp.]MCM1346287.1 T9SS type A sorting domain-containing protein [Bacteroides sp.]MCM1420858.1 T9SS type A sorting domain-containing protein [Bacteroides sp.]
MKKIYTLLAAMLLTVTTAFAQTLGVTVNGVPMSDGVDYTLSLSLDEFKTVVPGDFEAHVYAMEPEVFVSSSVAQTVSVTAEDLDRIEGKAVEGNAQICFGGQCEPLETRNDYTVTKTKDMAAGSSLDTETHISFGSVLIFDGEVWDGTVPTFPVERRIRLTVKAGDEVFSFVLYFVCDPDNILSVNGVSTDNVVNATAEGINYNLPESGVLNVYSANGAAVMHETVEGSGSVSLSNLSAGVYVYSLKAGSKHYTGKVAVK